MLNQVVLVGRLTEDPELLEHENGKKVISVVLAVQRAFKNTEGIYETDFIRCVLWNGIAANTSMYCSKGDVVGIKGRIQNNNYVDDNGNKHYQNDIIVERVSFVSSKKNHDTDDIKEVVSKEEQDNE